MEADAEADCCLPGSLANSPGTEASRTFRTHLVTFLRAVVYLPSGTGKQQ